MGSSLVARYLVIAEKGLGDLCENTILGINDLTVQVNDPADFLQVNPCGLEFCPHITDDRGLPRPGLAIDKYIRWRFVPKGGCEDRGDLVYLRTPVREYLGPVRMAQHLPIFENFIRFDGIF